MGAKFSNWPINYQQEHFENVFFFFSIFISPYLRISAFQMRFSIGTIQ